MAHILKFHQFCFCVAVGHGGLQGCKRLIAMVMLSSLLMMVLPGGAGLTCPSSCSTISQLPYPFGAALGCGSPGFHLDCSYSPPQWNITLVGYTGSYHIINISSNPNHSNPQAGSYGYGGTVLVDATPKYPNFTCQVVDANTSATNNFVSSDLDSFEDANLIYYQDSFFFFNCTEFTQPPTSGVLTNSSPSCTRYLEQCGLSTTSCMEYIPDQRLQLSPFSINYKCMTRTRFVIPPGDDNVSSWKPYTQFAWGPVKYADSCDACQRTGGTCGYATQDNSFLCYCGDTANQEDCNSGNTKAVAIGVSVSVVGLLFILGIAFVYRHKCGMIASRKFAKMDGINEAALELPYWVLSAATKSFSTKIGQGAFSIVYRGMLYDGSEVAVKVLDLSISHTDDQFMTEVATIGNIHHMNIARLVGYCFQKSKRILVYEYVSNGSLDRYLFPKPTEVDVPLLSWNQRYEIALGVARGLSYMHEECRRCIIHCDIKPQNILLDDRFGVKISDFGLARLLQREESRVLTQTRGTPGYVAPEFWSLGSGPLSAKFDVYSYGVVLLELVRGQRSFKDFVPFCEEEAEIGSFVSVWIDERIKDDANVEQAQLCTRVALWCIQEDPLMRPTMSQVVQFLQGTAVVPGSPPRPFRTMLQSEDSTEAFLKSSDSSYARSSRTNFHSCLSELRESFSMRQICYDSPKGEH